MRKAPILIGILLLSIAIACFISFSTAGMPHFMTMGIAAMMASVASIGIGMTENVSGPDRGVAAMLSLIPGLGHIYLHRNRSGLMLLCIATLNVSLISYVIASGESESFSDEILIICTMPILGSFCYSVLDTIKICNEYGLPEDDYFDANLNDPEGFNKALTVSLSVLLLAVCIVYVIISDGMPQFFALAFLICDLIYLIFAIYGHRFRIDRQNDRTRISDTEKRRRYPKMLIIS